MNKIRNGLDTLRRQLGWRPLRVAAGLTIACLLLSSFGSGGLATTSWAQTTTVSIDPASQEVCLGDTATTDVMVEDVVNLYGATFEISFNPALVEVVGTQIQPGDFLSPDWILDNTVDNNNGTITYSVCQMSPSLPRSGDGVLATITWRGKAAGTSPIHFTSVQLGAPGGVPIPADTEDGEIIVGVAPTITCPGDITEPNDPGQCSAVVTWPDPAVTGHPVPTVNCNPASGSTFPVGTTTVTCNATNTCGSAQCTFEVTVEDTEDPTITCPGDVTVNNDPGACYATDVDLGTPTTDDNCGVASVTNDAPIQFPVGETTVTWTVTDIHANTATCTQKVTVVDDENPTITCPGDVSVNNNTGACYATGVALGTPTTADNCGVASVTNDAPSQFPVGETIVTWTVTDIHGNTATCTQKVTVVDNENPTITCPGDVTVNNNTGACYATGVALGTPTTADNCGVASVTNDAPSQFPVGETIVTWTVTDIHANTATCTQKVTVVDNENPTITCPPDVTVKNDLGQSYATGVDLGTPTTDDNCGVASVTNDAPSQFPMGETIVTWTVTDIHDNTATCTQKVTVVANDLPVADADGPYSGDRTQTVTLDGSGSYDPDGTITNYEWQVDGAQVYSGLNATYGLALSGYSAGAHTVRLIVTDDDGATDDDTTNLTVNNFPPVADADGPYSGNRTQTVTLDGSDSSDSDGTITNYEWQVDGAQVYSGPSDTYGLALSGYSLGAHTVRLIVTDNDGATDDDTANLTVNNAPPAADADGSYSGNRTETVTLDGSGSSDPDGTITNYEWQVDGAQVYSGPSATYHLALSGYSLGAHTVRLIVTDNDGATDDDTTNLTVNNAPPVADADGSYSGDRTETVTLDGSGSSDPDGTITNYEWQVDGAQVYSGPSATYGLALSGYSAGAHTVRLIVTDNNGATDGDTTSLTVNNVPPVADADGPYSGDRTETVTLDGSGSSDPDGTITNYEWQVDGTQVYSGPSATYHLALSGYSLGAHTVRLTVTDNDGATDDDTANLTVNNAPPVANDDFTITDEDTPVGVDVTANDSDPDGTIDPTTVSIVSGPSHGSVSVDPVSGEVTYTPDPDYNGDDAFTYTVDDDDGATSNEATVTVTVNPEHGTAIIVTLVPASQTISAGESIAYTVWATDTHGTTWNASFEASYAIDSGAGGSWAKNVYTSEFAGTWMITATVDSVDDNATLTVEHGTATTVTLSPASTTITAGQSQAYTVWATDAYGNGWDATSEASYTIVSGAGGSWADNVYTSEFAGTWMITATVDGVDDNATLTVEHGTATTVTLSPASTTTTAGQSQAYTVWATDAYGNGWDATSEASYAIASGAGGSWADNAYTSEFAGTWMITATVDGVSDEATLTVNNPAPILTSLSPISATVGGPAFTLTVNGTNFVSGSVVQWGGSARTTTFVSNTRLTAAITASDIATVGTVNVTVVNPSPGGGTSNALPFEIAEMSPEPPSMYIYMPLIFSNSSSPRHMPHR